VIFAGTAVFAACVIGVTALVVARNDLAPETVRLLWLAAAAIIVVSFTPPGSAGGRRSSRHEPPRPGEGRAALHPHDRAAPSEGRGDRGGPDARGPVFGYGTLRIVGTGHRRGVPRVAHPQALREAVVRQAPGSAVSRAR